MSLPHPMPLIALLLAGTAAGPALALQQEQPPADPPAEASPAEAEAQPDEDEALDESDELLEEEEEAAIVVTAVRERGAVPGTIQPEQQFDAREIRALGAGSINELLEALAPQTQSGRGRGGERPIFLVNGRPISNFGEIRDIPPEALERVDILPEEAALQLGYRPDQRVVNFVLRERFRAITTEITGGFATAGGRGTYRAEGNYLRINREGRWSIAGRYERNDALLESERELVARGGGAFAIAGNIGSFPFGAEIDPALSALVGTPVTVAGVPASAASGAPVLGDFTGTAGQANVSDLGRFRTLLPATEQFGVNGTYSRTIFDNVTATASASVEVNRNESRLGLPSASLLVPAGNPFSPFGTDVGLYRYVDGFGPLLRSGDSWTGTLGLVFNGNISRWRWSLNTNYNRSESDTLTDRGLDLGGVQQRLAAGDLQLNPFGTLPAELIVPLERDRTSSAAQQAGAEILFAGPLASLPAGDIQTSLRAGFDTRGIESEAIRGGTVQLRELGRDRGRFQANVDAPIASRRSDVLSPLGELSANVNMAVEQLSDFGTLWTYGYGFNWTPIREINLRASVTHEEGAPTMQQLGDPATLTPNVRVLDFVRGETVDITRIEGGNPNLAADSRRVVNLGLRVRPLSEADLVLTANFTDTQILRPIAQFPTATAEIERAFPDRFVRDTEGRLISIDSRPVNFARSDRQELRWGVNFSQAIGPQGPPGGGFRRGGGGAASGGERRPTGEQPAQTGERPAQGDQPARRQGRQSDEASSEAPAQGAARVPGRGFGGRGFGGGRGGFGGGGPRGGRLQLSLYHSWRLQDEVLIREGLPVLDFLGGSAVGNRGGRPQHEIDLTAAYFRNGFGARLTGNWQSGTTVSGDGTATGDLRFSDVTSFNLQLFANLGQQRRLVEAVPFLRGSRISIGITNLFDSRPEVRDATGATPLAYQPAYLDPLGRSVRISFRKQFF